MCHNRFLFGLALSWQSGKQSVQIVKVAAWDDLWSWYGDSGPSATESASGKGTILSFLVEFIAKHSGAVPIGWTNMSSFSLSPECACIKGVM